MLRATRNIINNTKFKLAVATTCLRRITGFSTQTVRYTRQIDNISDTVSLLGRGDDEISVTSELAIDNRDSTIDVLNGDEVVSVKENDLIGWNGNEVVDANKEIDIDVNQNYLYYGLDLTIGSCFDLTQSDDEKYDDKVERHYKKKFNKKFSKNKMAYNSLSMLNIFSDKIDDMSDTVPILENRDDEIFVTPDMAAADTVSSIGVFNHDEVVSVEEKDLIDWYADVKQSYFDHKSDISIGSCSDFIQSDVESFDDNVELHKQQMFYKQYSPDELEYLEGLALSTLTIRSNMVTQGRIRLSTDESASSDLNDSGFKQFEDDEMDIGNIFRDSSVHPKPIVAGVRVENDINSPGFIGYTESGEIMVEPNVPVDVVIFGHGLEYVDTISFTDSICLTSEFNVTSDSFLIHKDTRIVFKHTFIEWATPWRICVRPEHHSPFLIDDDRTWIVTEKPFHETYFPTHIQISIMVVMFILSSLCSGLNIGLMGLTPQELRILMKCGSEREQKYAKSILPVRMKGNQLLSTVIIVNVIVNAAITILFEDLTEGLIAFFASSAGIVVFGEILPQSLCVKYGLAIGAKTIHITKFFMLVTSPITYPLGKILDKYAGTDIDTVDRGRIVEMLKMNMEQGQCDTDMATLRIAVGAMELRKKSAKDVMTKIDDVFMLSEDQVLNAETMLKISDSGYSRIPVYEQNNRNKVKSLLYVSDLALIGKDNNITVRAVAGFNKRKLRIIDENMPLIALLEEFKLGDYHLAMVAQSHDYEKTNNVKFVANHLDHFLANSLKVVEATAELLPPLDPENDMTITLVGLVTLEDITEELLQSEITDETDCDVTDEAQKRRRAHMSKKRIAELICSEKKSERLSLHMLQMTERWLLEKSPLFDPVWMDPQAFENLIQRNIREVLIVPPKNSTAPSTVKLYEHGAVSKRFILLLEGKASIVFRDSNLVFEVGPWTCLGEAILTMVEKSLLECKEPLTGFYFKPDYDLIVSKNCRFLQISTSSLFHSVRITQFVRELKTPKLSVTSDDNDSVPELRKFTRGAASPSARKRSASSIIGSLALPPIQIATKIASVEELKPFIPPN
ncbi:unnamed protein product [Caenorhabditis angaria]|uniref:Metal transporter n=1 Tax=Caenorhabditis angaria TaxID=860376 RepID=A0A9P1J4J7_9PELO|nr:unnamed protein product [Caenorhabditis angaria]